MRMLVRYWCGKPPRRPASRAGIRSQNMATCGCCQKTDEEHEMTECARCGVWMCPACLYIRTMNDPCHCPACRAATRNTAKWKQTICLVKKGNEDYLDRFAAQYPQPGKWALLVCDSAGTTDANVCIPVEAGKMLADFEDWSRRAQSAMRSRRATSFDSLASELDDMMTLFGNPTPAKE